MPRTKLFDEQEALQKAMDLFWSRGYHATSMQDLVDHLGINRASLYGTFGGKRELFDKAFDLYRKINLRGVRDFLSSYPNVKEGLKALFYQAIDEILIDSNRKGCFVVNTTTEFMPGDEAMENELKRNKTAFENIFYNYLKQGVEKEQIRKDKDVRAIASMLFTLYNGLKVVGKIENRKNKMRATIDAALTLLD